MAGETANNQRWSLKGMTALVTGGTRGTGKATVEELASFGTTVHTCALNEKRLNDRLDEWKAKAYNVTGSICDLYSRPAREELMKTVSSLFDGEQCWSKTSKTSLRSYCRRVIKDNGNKF